MLAIPSAAPVTFSLPQLRYQLARGLLFLLPVLLMTTRAGTDIAVSSIAALFLWEAIATRSNILKMVETKILLVFWLYLTLSQPLHGWDFKPFFHAFTYVRFLLFYLALRCWLLTLPGLRLKFALWTLGVVALGLIDALVQYKTGMSLSGRRILEYRLTGPLSHANIGNLIAKLFFACMALLLLTPKPLRRWAVPMGAFTLLVLAFIPLTGERSITLLMIGAALASGTLLAISGRAMRRMLLLAMPLLALIGAVLWYQPVVQLRIDMLKQHLSTFWETPYGQLFIGGYEVWREAPVIGTGIQSYYQSCLPIQERGQLIYCDIHPHNTYLQLLAETGIAGAFCFLLIVTYWGIFAWMAWKGCGERARRSVAMAVGGMVLCLFPLIVTQSIFSNWAAALFWCVMAMNIAALQGALANERGAR